MPFPTQAFRADAYPAYKSRYGPKYHYRPNVMGITSNKLFGFGMKAGAFGGVALFAVIFYASGIPRLQRDVLQQVPIVGHYFIKEPKPASDNPF